MSNQNSATMQNQEANQQDKNQQNPKMPFYHMWTDDQNHSRIDALELTNFDKKSISGDADPQWLKDFPGNVTAVKFAVLPVGWIGEWHESPKPQWVVTIKGSWFIETQDGHRVEMGPGEIHFGQDLGTEKVDGNKGHKSGTVGNEPCYQMIVQYDPSPVSNTLDPF